MSTAVETMKNLATVMQKYSNDSTAQGTTLLNDAIRSVSKFASLDDAITHFVSDTTSTATYSDVNERLKNVCGIVLGDNDDYSVDTGAITGANSGGSMIKNAVTIVPETSELTNLSLPSEGSTTTHTYTGADGQQFTFNVKWPSSFTSFYDYTGVTEEDAQNLTESDIASRYVDITTFTSFTDSNYITVTSEQMISGMNTVIKGLYNFWLGEGLKLAYDSYGLDFNGKTIEISFAGGGYISNLQAMTGPAEDTTLPADTIQMTINLPMYSVIDPDDQNGDTNIDGGAAQGYLDRTIAHELIHAVMQGKGILKAGTPEFFSEGSAEFVHGLDDYDGGNTKSILNLANSYESLSAAMPLASCTGTDERYTSGYMFLRYISQQSLNTSIQIGSTTSADTFNYTGGTAIVSNYNTGDKLNYSADFTGLEISSDDLVLNSSSGKVYLRDVRNTLVTLTDVSGNNSAYGYMASTAGELNGKNYDKYEVIIGADSLANTIIAGDNGTSLWGGSGSADDSLIGGSGVDNFFYSYGNGNDTIQSANSEDFVRLMNISVSQISNATITDSGVNATFDNGNTLTISGQAGNFIVDGKTYHADYQNKVWTE